MATSADSSRESSGSNFSVGSGAAAFWMNMQARFELETTEDELAPADQEDCAV